MLLLERVALLFSLLPMRLDGLREATADLQDLRVQLLHLVPHLLRVGGRLLKLYASQRSREVFKLAFASHSVHGIIMEEQLQTHTGHVCLDYCRTCMIRITRIAPFCFDCTKCSSSSRFFWSGRVFRATRSNSGSCFSTVSTCFCSAFSDTSKCYSILVLVVQHCT